MGYLERTGRVGLEEGTENFLRLSAGAVAGRRNDRHFQIVREPAGKRGGVSQRKVLGDRGKDGELSSGILGERVRAGLLQLDLAGSGKADAQRCGHQNGM